MKKLFRLLMIGAVAISLTACCDDACRKGIAKDEAFHNGQVQLVTTSPDGVKLWKAFDQERGETIYFSTHGTSYEENCGKGCTRTVTVPGQ